MVSGPLHVILWILGTIGVLWLILGVSSLAVMAGRGDGATTSPTTG